MKWKKVVGSAQDGCGWSLLLWVGLNIIVGEAQYYCGWIFRWLRLGLKVVLGGWETVSYRGF